MYPLMMLGDICKNLDNRRIPITKKDRVVGDVPYYGASGIVDYVKDYIFDEELLLVSEDGANLLARVYPIAFSVSGKTWINNHAHVLKFDDAVTQNFIEYFLNSIPLNDFVSGMAQPKLNQRSLNSIPVPYPSELEQKRIVAILDEAFANIEQVRANTEQNLKNARELFESYLQQVFSQRGEGWVEHYLGDICTFKHGFAFKSEYFCNDSDFLLLTPGNFFEAGGYRERGEKQKYYNGSFPKEFLLNEGDLLIAMTEQAVGLLGSPALVPEDGRFLHNQRLGLVQLTPKFEGHVKLEFLFHLFNTDYFRSKVQETASGLKVRHTSPKKMQSIPVWIPSDLIEQGSIANKLFKIKEQSIELEKIYSEKLMQLDELKKSILQKAFSGELTKNTSSEMVYE